MLSKAGRSAGWRRGQQVSPPECIAERAEVLGVTCCGLGGAGEAGGSWVRRGARGPNPAQGREERRSSPCCRPHQSTKRTPSLYYRNSYETAPRKNPHIREKKSTNKATHRRGAGTSPRCTRSRATARRPPHPTSNPEGSDPAGAWAEGPGRGRGRGLLGGTAWPQGTAEGSRSQLQSHPRASKLGHSKLGHAQRQ